MTVIFDLDNTLYEAKQYHYGGFERIADHLSREHSLVKQEVYERLKTIWKEKSSMYPHLFDDLLRTYGLEDDVKHLVRMFNNYDCELTPYSDTLPTINELRRRKYKLGIVTDGDPDRQKRKIESLGLLDLFDAIVYTKALEVSKSSTIPFSEVLTQLNADPEESYYVGDNPLIDFKGAKEAGLRTIRLLRGEFRNRPKNEHIDMEINGLEEIVEVVNNG